MRKPILSADRLATVSLRLVYALNLAFLAAFLLVAGLAIEQARAEDTAAACTGSDLMSELERNDPAAAGRIAEEAAATPNGEGLLWRIEAEGAEPSYLFGTMHMTDPRVVALTPPAQAAFDKAETVVIETTDVLDQTKMMTTIMQRPELTMLTGGDTLSSLIPEDDRDEVASALAERGIPLASVERMAPWMLSAMIALPACEIGRKKDGAPVLDLKLAKDAEAAGKPVKGLETMVDQLEAMASLPMSFHIEGMVETLKLGDRIDDVIETMIVLYGQGKTGTFWPLFRAVLPSTGDQAGFAEFEERMITARNHTMVENARPILAEGNAFIAVGALHLPGPDGVVELLRRAGYKISPVS